MSEVNSEGHGDCIVHDLSSKSSGNGISRSHELCALRHIYTLVGGGHPCVILGLLCFLS